MVEEEEEEEVEEVVQSKMNRMKMTALTLTVTEAPLVTGLPSRYTTPALSWPVCTSTLIVDGIHFHIFQLLFN